jgi:hypothetical protein
MDGSLTGREDIGLFVARRPIPVWGATAPAFVQGTLAKL